MVRNTNTSRSNAHNPPSIMDPSQNQSSHYYVHPGENPSIAPVNPPLTKNNYHSWSKLMKRALISKNKFKFLDGTIPTLDSFHLSYDAWERCNNLIHSWIVNSDSPSIAQSIVHVENAAVVWKTLRERFAQGYLVRIADLQHELYSFKQGNLSANDFFTQLTVYWEELENYRPITNCNCDGKKYREEDYVIRFLKGLNDSFSAARSQILLMDPLPPLNRVLSMILQHERQNCLDDSEDNQAFVNFSDGKRFSGRGKGFSSKLCIFCGRTGHTEDICFHKHGYPPGSKYNGKGGQPMANYAANDDTASRFEDEVTEKEHVSSIPTLSHEDYKALMTLLQSSGLKSMAAPSTANHTVNQACTLPRPAKIMDYTDEGQEQEDDWLGEKA